MLNFDFLEKGLWILSLPRFVYDFSQKLFVKLCSLNWPNFIVWLLLFLEMLDYMCIAIVSQVCFFHFEINLSNQAVFLNDKKVKTKI